MSIATMVTDAGTTLASAVGVCWDLVTANPVLLLFAGAGIVSLGFRFFKKAKGIAK